MELAKGYMMSQTNLAHGLQPKGIRGKSPEVCRVVVAQGVWKEAKSGTLSKTRADK